MTYAPDSMIEAMYWKWCHMAFVWGLDFMPEHFWTDEQTATVEAMNWFNTRS